MLLGGGRDRQVGGVVGKCFLSGSIDNVAVCFGAGYSETSHIII